MKLITINKMMLTFKIFIAINAYGDGGGIGGEDGAGLANRVKGLENRKLQVRLLRRRLD